MAAENARMFEDLLKSDDTLQSKFRSATESYEGSPKDEHALFDTVIAPLAQEAGLPFTLEELKEYAASGRELNDEELAAVAGGGSYCYIIGGGEGDGTWACTTWDNGAGACDYVGISLMWNDH